MKKVLALVLIIPILITGCWDMKIYERIGFILNIGVESSKDEGLLVTYTSPVIAEGKKQNEVELIEVTGKVLRDAREKARRMSAKLLEAGKIQQLFVSDEYAQNKSIHQTFEVLERDPTDPIHCWVVIVEGSPSKMLKALSKFTDKPRPSIYMDNLLENISKSSYIPDTKLVDFDICYFAPGLDPILPLVKLSGQEVIATGSALFSGDKMTGKINTRQTFLTLAMMGKAKKAEFASIDPLPVKPDFGNERDMSTDLVPVKRKIDVEIENGRPVVNIYLKFDGYISEYKWDNLDKATVRAEIENYLEKRLENDCDETARLLQQHGCDAIGIGDIVRAKYNGFWKSVDWKDAYKETKINVDIDVNIKQFGVIN
ncbi:MAG: Ger(x)C family spore germination protein [Clostridiales bacterium]|nr:Ger(x)C family spore germination protein [Clostridiales bacterium]